MQTEMANLSRPITREEPELRSILPKADSDPDDFMGRICQKASGTGADPIQSGEAGWQFSRGGVLGRARAPRPAGWPAHFLGVLCGRALTLGHGNLLYLLWKGSRLTLPKPGEGGKERTTPGQSLMGTDAKVLNQLVANGNCIERDPGPADRRRRDGPREGWKEKMGVHFKRRNPTSPSQDGLGFCRSPPTPPHPAIP